MDGNSTIPSSAPDHRSTNCSGDSSVASYHELFQIIGQLKDVERTGWVLRGVTKPESVADHMYRMAVMALTLPIGPHLSRDRMVKLSLVHDIAESIVGDLIVGYEGLTKQVKHDKELAAVEKLKNLIPDCAIRNDFAELWNEYENQSSEEAKFVKDLDRYDMILQAFQYEKNEGTPGKLQEFFDSTRGTFKSDIVKNLVDILYKDREIQLKL